MSLESGIDDRQAQPICLEDRTRGPEERDNLAASDRAAGAGGVNGSSKAPSALRRPRGQTIRNELTRLKYARFQEGRYDEDDAHSDTERPNEAEGSSSAPRRAHRRGFEPPKPGIFPSRSKHAPSARKTKQSAEPEVVIDILYENQRGWFFCGIPLFASRSLLNFDPAPWQTGDHKDSPVNITNAQVPDPTWTWSWPSWYVDMSHDVDEEGWEYSLSFQQGFAWHGSSPWWSSNVRRRRWLRKRVRTHALHGAHDAWHGAHRMNPDYFTIHGVVRTAGSSRSSSREGSTRPTSALFNSEVLEEAAGDDRNSDEDPDANIPNITALLRRFKGTTVDRKKLDALRQFLRQGGSELHYLPDAMTTIMSLFMYQHSRREALAELQQALKTAKGDLQALYRPEHEEPAMTTSPSGSDTRSGGASQQTEDLQRAIDAVATVVHTHDLAPDGTIRSPTSAHYQYHYNPYPSHHTHSRPHHERSQSGAKYTHPSKNLALALPSESRLHEELGDGSDNASATSTSRDHDVVNPYATPSASVAGSTVDLGSSPTREVGAEGTRIKGIPAAAHIGEDLGIVARMESEVTAMRDREEEEKRNKMGKGKGKDIERRERKEWDDDGVD